MQKQCSINFNGENKRYLEGVLSVVNGKHLGANANISLVCKENTITFIAYNLAYELSVFMPCSMGGSEEWSVTVPSSILGKIMALKYPVYNFIRHDNKVEIRAGGAGYALPIIQGSVSPFDKIVGGDRICSGLNGKFWSSVSKFTSRGNEMRSVFEFCRFFNDGNVIKLWASDDKSFMQRLVAGSTTACDIFIHRSIMETMGLFDDATLYAAWRGFIYKDNMLQLKFMSGDIVFPDLNIVGQYTQKAHTVISFEAKDMMSVLDSIGVVADNMAFCPVLLTEKDKTLYLEIDGQKGNSIATFIDYSKPFDKKVPLNITLNFKDFDRALSYFGGTVNLGITESPCFLSSSEIAKCATQDYVMLMPIVKYKE